MNFNKFYDIHSNKSDTIKTWIVSLDHIFFYSKMYLVYNVYKKIIGEYFI